jgi:hypothetical protein
MTDRIDPSLKFTPEILGNRKIQICPMHVLFSHAENPRSPNSENTNFSKLSNESRGT